MVSKSGEFSSSSLRCKTGPYNGFEVMFERGIVLVKNTTYCIQADLTGATISRPQGRFLNRSLCSGVTFTFMNNYVEEQFPELLFTL